jgi:hypothetical protein
MITGQIFHQRLPFGATVARLQHLSRMVLTKLDLWRFLARRV